MSCSALVDAASLSQVLVLMLNAALRALPVVPDRPGSVTVRLGCDVDQWPEIEIAFECAHARPTPEARRLASCAREAI